MVPPVQAIDLDLAALSGICGSISIACWVVVFSPQIVENFRRSSADGLSLQFILVWLLGDVFNILGAVLQGVLPTMIILALYYTIADIVLLGQCFYYRGFTFRDAPVTEPLFKSASDEQGSTGDPTEATGLLSPRSADHRGASERRWSGEHLSPVVPMIIPASALDPAAARRVIRPRPSRVKAALFSVFAVLMVCLAGILGWYFSSGTQRQPHHHRHHTHDHAHTQGSSSSSSSPLDEQHETLTFNVWGQTFGYLCAVLYLLSRLPQILLNYRRKSTEGVSMLFFLFACIGNLTYVLSILAFEPRCLMNTRSDDEALALASSDHLTPSLAKCGAHEAHHIYARYIAVNASWILGSAGTLFLDFAIFCQFFYYREQGDEFSDDEGEGHRPLLE